MYWKLVLHMSIAFKLLRNFRHKIKCEYNYRHVAISADLHLYLITV